MLPASEPAGMLEVDGAEGGGQLLRTTLALAALTGKAVEMTAIRGDRPEPGLRPQHLAAVRLLADVCDAEVADVAVGTESLTFDPGEVRPGRYAVDVGTAGSLPLLFDAVLPLAAAIDEPLVVAAAGGTDVKWSPTMAYYRRVKLPLLGRLGVLAAVDLDRRGFYPAGGGRATLVVGPSTPDPVDLVERGDLEAARIVSIESESLAEQEVATRQATAAAGRLEAADVSVVERTVETAATDSPGSAVLVGLDYEGVRVGFDALGEPGTPAEDVGETAADAALAFDDGPGAVDRHMADQLLAFLAIAGGRLEIPAVTDHVATSRRLLETFGFETTLDRTAAGVVVEAPERGRR